jgi:K+/H+ antiporter YhaU regulatory subunit KhtT
VYLSWFARFRAASREADGAPVTWEGARKHLPKLILYLLAGFAVLTGANALAPRATLAPGLYWGGIGVLLFPILLGIAYGIDGILWNDLVLKWMHWKGRTAQSEQAHDMLHNLLRFVLVALSCVPLLILGAFFVPFLSLAVAMLGLIGVSTLMFWGSARRLHESFERVVMSVFEEERPLQGEQVRRAHDELVQLIREEYPWEVETQDLVLPIDPSGANRAIKDLKLRTETGATIAAIYRGEEAIVNPPADTLLMPGDVLLLMGSREQIAAAAKFLQERMLEPVAGPGRQAGQPKTQRIEISPECAWIGKTLGEMNLRRQTGVHVVGIHKGGTPLTNPDPSVVVERNDVLFLFGLEEQLERAKAVLAQAGA